MATNTPTFDFDREDPGADGWTDRMNGNFTDIETLFEGGTVNGKRPLFNPGVVDSGTFTDISYLVGDATVSEIQSFLDNNDGCVFIGDFTIDDSITIPSGTIVEGRYATFTVTTNQNFIDGDKQGYVQVDPSTTTTDVGLYGLTVIGRGAATTGDRRLAYFDEVDGFEMHECTFKDGRLSNLEIANITNFEIGEIELGEVHVAGVANGRLAWATDGHIGTIQISGYSPDLAWDMAEELDNVTIDNLSMPAGGDLGGLYFEDPDTTNQQQDVDFGYVYADGFGDRGVQISAVSYGAHSEVRSLSFGTIVTRNCQTGALLYGEDVSVEKLVTENNDQYGVEINLHDGDLGQIVARNNGQAGSGFETGVYFDTNCDHVTVNHIVAEDTQGTATQNYGISGLDVLPSNRIEIMAAKTDGNALQGIRSRANLVVGDWGLNDGNPQSTGDWFNNGFEGVQVRDTTNNTNYAYIDGAFRTL